MLLHEQNVVLQYLGRRAVAPIAEVLKACLHGAPIDLGKRVLADLEWLGYVTVYSAGDGEPLAVQLTEKGRRQVQPLNGPHRRIGGLALP